jgi:hypothetical protein
MNQARAAMTRPVVPPGPPEDRDFGGVARLIGLVVAADGSPPSGRTVTVEDRAGRPIPWVTRLELALDADSLTFRGHMTRIADDAIGRDDQDRPVFLAGDGEPRLVREPVVVLRLDLRPPTPGVPAMEKNAMIGPATPDLDPDRPRPKQAAVAPAAKTPEELDRQDPLKRSADEVRGRLEQGKK